MSAPGPRAGSSARYGKSSKEPVAARAASRASVPGSEPIAVAEGQVREGVGAVTRVSVGGAGGCGCTGTSGAPREVRRTTCGPGANRFRKVNRSARTGSRTGSPPGRRAANGSARDASTRTGPAEAAPHAHAHPPPLPPARTGSAAGPDHQVRHHRVPRQVQGREDGRGDGFRVDPGRGVVLLALLLVDLRLHGRGGAAGVDGRDADAVLLLLGTQGVGEGLEAVLRGGVGGPLGARGESGAGVHEEDLAARGAQLRQEEAGQLGGGEEVDVDLLPPGLEGQLADGAEVDDARDVEERVDPLGQGLVREGPGEAVGLGEVADEGPGAGEGGGEFLRAARVAGEEDEVVAPRVEAAGHGGPDSGPGPGDHVRTHTAMIAPARHHRPGHPATRRPAATGAPPTVRRRATGSPRPRSPGPFPRNQAAGQRSVRPAGGHSAVVVTRSR
ncbi:putative short chain dehydrogenase [Streptomyces sp. Tu6071]|nr:putative short chain dehydrogenase [Streptomyces sp. Tu6071]